ncbi:hypothetical protein RRG08_051360 [Elysia crispata]|uniref:Uncharacterized protein n=1 Tax=Elysia crispata TaxID=231223 RepID=A0AAE1E993_9GAST|nr:hypothetical protein RRG08_051360 [Elysia crispata]
MRAAAKTSNAFGDRAKSPGQRAVKPYGASAQQCLKITSTEVDSHKQGLKKNRENYILILFLQTCGGFVSSHNSIWLALFAP